MTEYSNPRMKAVIENWPSGGKRVTCTFEIEYRKGKGERATRVTTGAAKKLTYAKKMRIVDGDDGRTYIIALTIYDSIAVYESGMQFQMETIWPRDNQERYDRVLALFN